MRKTVLVRTFGGSLLLFLAYGVTSAVLTKSPQRETSKVPKPAVLSLTRGLPDRASADAHPSIRGEDAIPSEKEGTSLDDYMARFKSLDDVPHAAQIDLIKEVVMMWGISDTAAVWSFCCSLKGDLKSRGLAAIVTSLATRDADAALVLYWALPGLQSRNRAAPAVLEHVARSDPQSALRVWKRLQEDPLSDIAISELVAVLSENSTPDLISLLRDSEGYLAVEELETLGRHFGGRFSVKNVDQITELSRDLPQAMRDTFLEAAMSGKGESSPIEVLRELHGLGLSQAREARIMRGAIKDYVGMDPEAAVRWAMSQSDPESVKAVLSSVIHAWLELDTTEVAEWIGAQREAYVREAAILEVINYLSSKGAEREVEDWEGLLP